MSQSSSEQVYVPEIVGHCYRAGRTGILSITNGEITKNIHFDTGTIVFADSNAEADKLTARTTHDGLIDNGNFYFREEDLKDYFTQHIATIVKSAFTWRDVKVEFKQTKLKEYKYTGKIPGIQLVFDGIRDCDEIELVKEMIGNLQEPLRFTDSTWQHCNNVSLQPQEAFIIACLEDSRLSPNDLIKMGTVTENVVLKTVCALLLSGIASSASQARKMASWKLPVVEDLVSEASATEVAELVDGHTDTVRTLVKRTSKHRTISDCNVGKLLASRFRVDTLLGRGGMGSVYRATDVVLDRTVAIKLLRHDIVEEQSLMLRFVREARAMARIEHPNMVVIYDYGTLADSGDGECGTYLVMEYINGCTLRDLEEEYDQLTPAQAVTLMRQTCGAIAAAHKAGVIHRDLKPENIMLKLFNDDQAIVKVVDLGVARLMESIQGSVPRITDKREVLGTPIYMSPEQCITSKIDERSDIYSLGIIFYELLAGKPPFEGSPATVMRKHHYDPVPSITGLNSMVPAGLEALVLSMLRKEKEERPDLNAILKQLDRFASELGNAKLPVLPIKDKLDKGNDNLNVKTLYNPLVESARNIEPINNANALQVTDAHDKNPTANRRVIKTRIVQKRESGSAPLSSKYTTSIGVGMAANSPGTRMPINRVNRS